MDRLLDHGHFRHHIIVGDIHIPCAAPVLTWHDHGLTFKSGAGARRRHPKQKIDLIVLHWTGGEGTAKQIYRTLTSRALGTEFVIDHEGLIWQFADPARIDTFDAGPVNPRSVGIEIANYGYRHGRAPGRGRIRPKYTALLNAKPRTFAGFFPGQMRSAVALCDALRKPFKLVERRIPRNGNGDLLLRAMTKTELADYRGVLGHFHVSRRKSDPGTEIFEALTEAGYE